MTLNVDELKPCPFCGSRPAFLFSAGAATINCRTPNCVAPSVCVRLDSNAKVTARDLWNRRTDPAAELNAELVEGLESMVLLANRLDDHDQAVCADEIDAALALIAKAKGQSNDQ